MAQRNLHGRHSFAKYFMPSPTCSRCSCSKFRPCNEGGKIFCEECGHGVECHAHYKRPRVDDPQLDLEEPSSLTISAECSTSQSVRPAKRAVVDKKDGCDGVGSIDGYWSGTTLRGGLKVFEPRQWCLGDEPAALRRILEEDGVVAVPGAIPEAAATAFGEQIQQAYRRMAVIGACWLP